MKASSPLGLFVAAFALGVAACTSRPDNSDQKDSVGVLPSGAAAIRLPEPDTNASKNNFSNVIGWRAGKAPVAPAGFTVMRFAEGIKSPRNIYVAPNGDILVALSNSERSTQERIAGALSGKSKSEVGGESLNTIMLYRDRDGDGKPEVSGVFLRGLNQPFGMLIIGNAFYVANTDGLLKFPYTEGDIKITGNGRKIVDLPAGGYNNHWTRNLVANADQSKIYISVGSASNVAEHGIDVEKRRAGILEVNPDGSGEQIYASGLRNPVGMAWAPGTSVLWTTVNERDGLGDDLVPDYMTGVKAGGFYGWPYAYYGANEDPRRKGERPDLVKTTLVPDVPLGAHTASLGLAFASGNRYPAPYSGGAFVGQHGSWNRAQLSGYKVVYVPFSGGKPSGKPQDFLTGFIANGEKSEVYGRPVGVTFDRTGALLVADDVARIIWRVAAK